MNVIGSRPTGWWRDRNGAVRGLLGRLQGLVAATGEPVTLALDGRPLPDVPEAVHDGVRVCYARRGGPDAADDRIVELLEEEGADDVVTSDGDLRRRAEALGAGVHGTSWLLTRLDTLEGSAGASSP